MKKILLVIFALLSLQAANAQNTLAKIKFEDAEKAYYDGDYQNCLQLLNETEKILGQSAPNILFLKILAGHKLLEADKNYPYSQLATLRDQTNFYLTNYDITGLEEKYKQIYEVSNSLKDYPENERTYQQRIDEEPKRLATIINNYIEAIGGREKVSTVKTIFRISKSTGDYNQHEKYEFPDKYTAYLTDRTFKRIRPWNRYLLSENEGYFIQNKKEVAISEDTKRSLRENIKMNSFPELYFFNEGYELKFIEEKNEKGQALISIMSPDGKEEIRYYNIKTHFLETIVYSGSYYWSQTPVKRTIVYFSDYRQVNGVLLPFKSRYVTIGEKNENFEWFPEIIEIHINQNVTAADFQK